PGQRRRRDRLLFRMGAGPARTFLGRGRCEPETREDHGQSFWRCAQLGPRLQSGHAHRGLHSRRGPRRESHGSQGHLALVLVALASLDGRIRTPYLTIKVPQPALVTRTHGWIRPRDRIEPGRYGAGSRVSYKG